MSASAHFDSLEVRALLEQYSSDLAPNLRDLTDVKNGPMANAGQALINLYQDYLAFQTQVTSWYWSSGGLRRRIPTCRPPWSLAAMDRR